MPEVATLFEITTWLSGSGEIQSWVCGRASNAHRMVPVRRGESRGESDVHEQDEEQISMPGEGGAPGRMQQGASTRCGQEHRTTDGHTGEVQCRQRDPLKSERQGLCDHVHPQSHQHSHLHLQQQVTVTRPSCTGRLDESTSCPVRIKFLPSPCRARRGEGAPARGGGGGVRCHTRDTRAVRSSAGQARAAQAPSGMPSTAIADATLERRRLQWPPWACQDLCACSPLAFPSGPCDSAPRLLPRRRVRRSSWHSATVCAVHRAARSRLATGLTSDWTCARGTLQVHAAETSHGPSWRCQFWRQHHRWECWGRRHC